MKSLITAVVVAVAGLFGTLSSAHAQTVVSLSVVDAEAAETWPGQPINRAMMRVSRTGTTATALTVWIKVSGTAFHSTDYQFGLPSTTTLLIPAGQVAVDVPVTPVDDSTIEVAEKVRLELDDETTSGTALPYGLGTDRVEITVYDNDSLPTPAFVSVSAPASAHEGTGGVPTPGIFRLTRTGSMDAALTINLATVGTAESGSDYVALPGSVDLAAGQASVDVVVMPIDDAVLEVSESVSLSILPATSSVSYPPAASTYAFGPSVTAQLSITDNEVPPVRAVVSVEAIGDAAEGGVIPGRFRITRSAQLDVALTVAYTLSGSATPGADYGIVSSWVPMPAGMTSVDVTIQPVDDLVLETSETVSLVLQATTCPGPFPPSSCYLLGSAPVATLSIQDDEVAPSVSVTVSQDPNVAGVPAAGLGSFTASAPGGHIVSYVVRVDGTQRQSGSTSYPAPPAAGTVFESAFPITGLTAGGHTVQVSVVDHLGNGATASALLTIVPIVPPPPTIEVIAIDAEASETLPGEAPNTARLRFITTGTPDLGFSFFSFGGTARENVDYTVTYESGISSREGLVTRWSQDMIITPIDDLFQEVTEGGQMQLCSVIIAWVYGVGAPIGTECGSLGAGFTILDNDSSPTVSTLTIRATDGDASEVSLISGSPANPGQLRITRSTPLSGNLTVSYTVTGPALAGSDYGPLPATAVIPDGQASIDLPVTPFFDTVVEGSEVVTVTLLPPSIANAYVIDPGTISAASVVIHDYAPAGVPVLRVKVTDALAYEQASQSPHGAIRIERTGDLAVPFSLPYQIGGSATHGVDYVALSGTASFAAGSNVTTITIVPYLDSELNEPDEAVIITLPRPPADVFPPPYLLAGSGSLIGSAGVVIREDAPVRTTPLDRFERARRIRFPGRYRIVSLPVLPEVPPAVLDALPAAPVLWAVDASCDLTVWEELGQTEDPEEFVDVDGNDCAVRFYRFRQISPSTTP